VITTAFINLWDKRVGAIAWNPNTEIASFEYDPSFYTNNWDISPIKKPTLSHRLSLVAGIGLEPMSAVADMCPTKNSIVSNLLFDYFSAFS
jgi:HipA N-terminal domain